jgi:hypothetical protein
VHRARGGPGPAGVAGDKLRKRFAKLNHGPRGY